MGNQYYEQKLNEMPADVLEKAVAHLQSIMPKEHQEEICGYIDQYGLHEWVHAIHAHFGYGMFIRNQLREAGLSDDLLPDQNWDDYYVSVIEIAVGKRPNPLED